MKQKYWLLLFAMFVSAFAVAAPPVEQGKTIFNARCASCHNVNKALVGPALAGVDQRRDIDWIVKFVQSSQNLIKSGDKDAAAVFAKFNNIPMPDHADLKEADIKGIVEYIKSEAVTSDAAKAPFPKPFQTHPAYTPLTFSNTSFFVGLGAMVVLLVFSLLIFVRVKEYERNRLLSETDPA